MALNQNDIINFARLAVFSRAYSYAERRAAACNAHLRLHEAIDLVRNSGHRATRSIKLALETELHRIYLEAVEARHAA